MLMEQFKYKNIHEVPKITKITINQGLGDASKNNKALESQLFVKWQQSQDNNLL